MKSRVLLWCIDSEHNASASDRGYLMGPWLWALHVELHIDLPTHKPIHGDDVPGLAAVDQRCSPGEPFANQFCLRLHGGSASFNVTDEEVRVQKEGGSQF